MIEPAFECPVCSMYNAPEVMSHCELCQELYCYHCMDLYSCRVCDHYICENCIPTAMESAIVCTGCCIPKFNSEA